MCPSLCFANTSETEAIIPCLARLPDFVVEKVHSQARNRYRHSLPYCPSRKNQAAEASSQTLTEIQKKKNQSILTKSHANVKLGLAADKETSKILKRLLEKACARKTEQRFSGCPTNSFLPASSFYPLFISSPLKQTISVLSWAKELLCTIWLFLRITCALTTSSMWVVSEFISSSGMILKATRLFLFCPKGKNQFK